MADRSCHTPAEGESGYIMVLALVTILVLSLGLAVAAQQVHAARIAVDRIDRHAQTRFDMISDRNRLIFAILKHEDVGGAGGLDIVGPAANARIRPSVPDLKALGKALSEELRFDPELLGKQFEWTADTRLTIVKDTGLIDLNTRNDSYIETVASRLGARDPEALVASLRDFTDEDTRVRFKGAEQSAYGDRIAVPNLPLRHRDDVCQVRGWGELAVCQDARLRALSLNVDTGGPLVMRQSAEALQEALVGRLRRRRTPTGEWMEVATQEGFLEFALSGNRSSGTYRIVFEYADRPEMIGVATLRILPGSSVLPFEIKEFDLVAQNELKETSIDQ